jgi:hypothetical protein
VWYNYMWEHTYIGVRLLSIDIRPFNEEDYDTTSSDSPTDARVSEFIETLRARINSRDEAQRESWLKAAKPESKRKRITQTNPDWLKPNKTAHSAPKKSAAPHQRPPGSPVKKRSSR